MIKLLLIPLATAVLVAHGCSSDSETPSDKTPSTAASAPAAASSDSNSALQMAASAVGFGVTHLPEDGGCSPSILPAEKVQALVESLPSAQQIALAKLLDASSTAWSAQLYTGSHGSGLCLPARNELVVFPSGADSALASFQQMFLTNSLAQSASSLLSTIKPSR